MTLSSQRARFSITSVKVVFTVWSCTKGLELHPLKSCSQSGLVQRIRITNRRIIKHSDGNTNDT